MAIVLETTATASLGPPGTDITCNKPTGTVAGDVLVASVTGGNLSDIAISPPDGTWVEVGQDWNSVPATGMWVKVAGSSEPANYTFTYPSSSSARRATIARYSGADNTTPQDCAGTANTGSSTAPRGLSVTTVTDGAMLIMAIGLNTGNQTAAPTGMTEQVELDRHVFNDGVQASAGASGDKDSTTSASGAWVAILGALRPSGGAPATTKRYSLPLTGVG